jgi:hypothetical protein
MTRREPSIPVPDSPGEDTSIAEILDAIRESLLNRPLQCRGPFVISDRELQTSERHKTRGRLRVAT